MKHFRCLAKTILVRNNDIDTAYRMMNKILINEKVIENVRRKETFEPPTQQRRRVSFERCRRIYKSEMDKKIAFVMRKDRVDPWPR